MTVIATSKERIELNLPGYDQAINSVLAATPLSQAWLSHYLPLSEGNSAKLLISGSKVALFESAASWAIGLNRGAAASLRTYIENAFAWLYYKDHPIEFSLVDRHEDDLMLPKAVRAYAGKTDKGFDLANSVLFKVAARPDDYYYTNVSGFIHAHPAMMAGVINVADAAMSHPPEPQFLNVCRYADEFISDLYLARYRFHWDSIPEPVQENVSQRLGDKLPKFLAM